MFSFMKLGYDLVYCLRISLEWVTKVSTPRYGQFEEKHNFDLSLYKPCLLFFCRYADLSMQLQQEWQYASSETSPGASPSAYHS